jgi:hypothetical protein
VFELIVVVVKVVRAMKGLRSSAFQSNEIFDCGMCFTVAE